MAQQHRESAQEVIQSRLIKMLGAKPRLTKAQAQYLIAHAVPSDLSELAVYITERAKQEDPAP
jgi:hypothetical protein